MAAEDLALTVFAGQSTRNHWEDFFISPGSPDFASSDLLAGRCPNRWRAIAAAT